MPLTDTYPYGVLFVGGTHMTQTGTQREVVGTAFLVAVPTSFDENRAFWYIVTAAHVLTGLKEPFVRVPMVDGRPHDVAVSSWVFHPKGRDVAVAPFVPPEGSVRLFATNIGQFVDDEKWKANPKWHDMELGDVVYFIGLLGRVASMRNGGIPMVRSGTLGRLWQDGLPVRNGNRIDHVTAHLIDCRSFGGFSGSPCYVQHPRVYAKDGGVGLEYYTAFLGMIGGHFDDWQAVRGNAAHSDEYESAVNTGVGYVTPAEFIREALFSEELIKLREDQEREQLAEDHAAALKNAATPDSLVVDSERVSLAPLDPEAALRGLLRTPPQAQTEDPA